MSENCLMVKLPSAVTDDSLLKLNELRMHVILDITDGSSRILLNCIPNIKDGRYPIIKYSGGLKTTSGASLGTSFEVTKTHIDPIFPNVDLVVIEPRKGTYVSIENADRLSILKSEKIGGGWGNDTFLFDFDEATAMPECLNFSLSTAKLKGDAGYYIGLMPKVKNFYLWNPSFSFDASYVREGLQYLQMTTRNFLSGISEPDTESSVYMDVAKLPSTLLELIVSAPASGSGVTGDIANLPNSLTRFSVHSACNKTTGDIKNLSKKMKAFSVAGDVLPEGRYTYTGASFEGYTFSSFRLTAILSSVQLDAILNAMTQATWVESKSLTLYGVRTSASDAAVSTLASKGVTVTINAN